MPLVDFPSSVDGEIIQVAFVTRDGVVVPKRLLVDSGFTGDSAFVLSTIAMDLAHSSVESAATSGALQGEQRRATVVCHIPAISFEREMIAILTDLAPLSLGAGVDGMAGLRFLRQFTRWGAERTHGRWRFILAVDD